MHFSETTLAHTLLTTDVQRQRQMSATIEPGAGSPSLGMSEHSRKNMWAKAKRASLFLVHDNDPDSDQEGDDDFHEDGKQSQASPWAFGNILKLQKQAVEPEQPSAEESISLEEDVDVAQAPQTPEPEPVPRITAKERWRKAIMLARTIGTVSKAT